MATTRRMMMRTTTTNKHGNDDGPINTTPSTKLMSSSTRMILTEQEDPSLIFSSKAGAAADTTSSTTSNTLWMGFSSTGGDDGGGSSNSMLSSMRPSDEDYKDEEPGSAKMLSVENRWIPPSQNIRYAKEEDPGVPASNHTTRNTDEDSAGSIYRDDEEDIAEKNATTTSTLTPTRTSSSIIRSTGQCESSLVAAVVDPYHLVMMLPVEDDDDDGPTSSTLADVSRRLGALWGCDGGAGAAVPATSSSVAPPPQEASSLASSSLAAPKSKASSHGAERSSRSLSLRRGLGSLFGGGGGSSSSRRSRNNDDGRGTPATAPVTPSMLQELDDMVQGLGATPPANNNNNSQQVVNNNTTAKNSMSGMQWRQTFQLPAAALPRVDATSTSSSTSGASPCPVDGERLDTTTTDPSFGFHVSVNLSEPYCYSATPQDGPAAAAAQNGWSKNSIYDGSTITSVPTAAHELGGGGGGFGTHSVYDGSTITSGGFHTWLSSHNNTNTADIRTLQSGEVFSYTHQPQQQQPTEKEAVPQAPRFSCPTTSQAISQNESNQNKSQLSSKKNKKKSNNDQSTMAEDKQPLWFICTVGILLILIAVAIVGATACGLGYCNLPQESAEEVVVMEPPPSPVEASSSNAEVGSFATVAPTRLRGASETLP